MSSTTETNFDGPVTLINETEIDDGLIFDELRRQHPEYSALASWGEGSRRREGIFQRDKYTNPSGIFDKMRTAIEAVDEDDIVSGVADTTEQLAFKRISMEVDDDNEESVWQEMVDRLDLPSFMREIWRDIFTVSQAYPAVIFGNRNFKSKARTEKGNRSRKEFKRLIVPIGLTLLDPLKVVPVGTFMFGQERLAYIADPVEVKAFQDSIESGDDQVIASLIEGKYTPGRKEAQELNKLVGGENISNRLFLLSKENVWRITATRQDYKRFASVRMESVFELLDLKHQLREMDRSALIGTTNAIILVKKGSPDRPAKKEEIEQLASQVKSTSRIPIIVGDDRIDIEIITPKTDKTLAAERYNGIDSRITSRLYQILSTGNYASGTATDDSMKLLRVVASSMEARRDVIRDSIMEHIFIPTYNINDELKQEPSMQFYPRRIALDFDKNIATFMQDLRDRGDISRETILAELDIDEEREAVKREREARLYDDTFSPTNVPFGQTAGNPAQNDPRTAGRRQGGDRNGGAPIEPGENPND